MQLADVDLTDHTRFAERVPHEMFAVLRREDPVHWQEEADGRGFWAITRHADITAVAKDWRTFSSERGGTSLQDLEPEELEARKSMLDMDPPPHNALRAIVNRDFTPRAVRVFTERIRELFDGVLDEALEKGEVEFVDDVAAKLPMRVFAEMLGAPEADHRYLVEIGDRMLGQDDPEFAIDPEVAEANRHLPFSNPAALEMFEYGRKLADERRECPRDDIVTKLVEAEIDGRPLTQHEYDVYFLLLAVAGNETTRHSISQGVLALIEYPDQLQRLRDDPDLLAPAADEILRWATPVHHFRRTATARRRVRRQDDPRERQARHLVHLGQLRRGGLRLPYEFDVGRDPNPQMTFGPGGPHFCTGAHLARLEIEIVFAEMVKRVASFELTGTPERLQSNFFNGIKRMPLRLTPA